MSDQQAKTNGLLQNFFNIDDYLETNVQAFLTDRRAANLAPGSLKFYEQKLALFSQYCQQKAISSLFQLTPADIRGFVEWMELTGHNPGGRHAGYRALKSFLLWFEKEYEPEGWKNPIRKTKAPRLAVEPLDPIPAEHISAMLDACPASTFNGCRDRAVILALVDTGCRASEFIAIDLNDVDPTGKVLLRTTKGGRPRNVFFGKQARQAIKAYLKKRADTCPALWVTDENERLTYAGLRQIIRRRAADAGLPEPGLHAFRRTFFIEMLRAGADLLTVSRLGGHASLAMISRYAKQTSADLQEAHRRASPADRL